MMIATTLSDAAHMLGLDAPLRDARFDGVSTDSRALRRGSLFIALQGPNFDGHDYLHQVADGGAVAALVSRPTTELPALEVANTRAALGQLAAAWRMRFELPLIAVTGSNGKTTVKEMLAAICRRCAPTLATAGNLNNDIGVPLTLLRLAADHRYAVVEMGANARGEIEYLTRLAQPGVGIVTNAAAAHLEGFGSLDGVARAKGELYATLPEGATAVINADDPSATLWREMAGARRVVSFGTGAECDVRLDESSLMLTVEEGGFACRMGVETPHGPLELALAMAGRHNALNALAATAAALSVEIAAERIVAGLAAVNPVTGRLQLRQGQQGERIIDDTYNANPHSLRAAIEVLSACPGERWLVLGDMGELGDDAEAMHAAVGEKAHRAGIERLFTVGSLSRHAAQAFGAGAMHSPHHQALVDALRKTLHGNVSLLVKGSRSMRMEQVVSALAVSTDTDAWTQEPDGES